MCREGRKPLFAARHLRRGIDSVVRGPLKSSWRIAAYSGVGFGGGGLAMDGIPASHVLFGDHIDIHAV